jgi:hypothetical protein
MPHQSHSYLKIGLVFLSSQDKSAARFCWQVVAWVPDMFFNFYLAKSHKYANNFETIEAEEKISTDFESLEV